MSKMLSRRVPFVTSVAIATFTGICLQSFPSFARFNPGGTVGKPGNRRGLATRGGGCKASSTPTLTTLVPKNNVGLSASATPTLYWFIPENTYEFVNVTLHKVDADNNPTNQIYTSVLQIPRQGGLASVTIPEKDVTQSLEAGASYRWRVKMLCTKDDRRGLSAMGWLTYSPPNTGLANQLVTAQSADRFNLYAEAGYWYDAVRELAGQRQADPNNLKVKQAWKSLMESEHVQLTQIADQ